MKDYWGLDYFWSQPPVVYCVTAVFGSYLLALVLRPGGYETQHKAPETP